MTLTLNLPPELESRLQESAAGAATTPETRALEAVREWLEREAAEDAADLAAAEEAQARIDSGEDEVVPWAEAKARLDIMHGLS
jgi:predicted transcriptional regulator